MRKRGFQFVRRRSANTSLDAWLVWLKREAVALYELSILAVAQGVMRFSAPRCPKSNMSMLMISRNMRYGFFTSKCSSLCDVLIYNSQTHFRSKLHLSQYSRSETRCRFAYVEIFGWFIVHILIAMKQTFKLNFKISAQSPSPV